MKIVIKAIFLMQTLNIQKLNLLNLHSDLSLLPEKIKIKKCNKPVCNQHDKKEFVVHIRTLKQALNGGLILKRYIE